MLEIYLEARTSERADANQIRQVEERRLTAELLDSTKHVLKSEWNRVKRGEPAFRLIKGAALVVTSILAVAFIVAIIPLLWVPEIEQKSIIRYNDEPEGKATENRQVPLDSVSE
jgi:hypothetical protein